MGSFDPEDPLHVQLYDESPLWSAMAGLLLLEHVPLAAKRVLDLGCGTGFPLFELAERLGPGAFACGADLWMPALRRARQKALAWPVGHAALVRADGAALPFRDGAFDLVVSNLGLNNFADAGAAARQCARVLAPGGTLVLTTNLSGHMREFYAAFEAVLAECGDAAALARLRAHVAHRGSVETLTALLGRAGLGVAAVHHREVAMRFAGAGALFAHHFIRMGFLPAWEAVVEEPDRDAVFAALRRRLDAIAAVNGELRLTVPLVCVLTRATPPGA